MAIDSYMAFQSYSGTKAGGAWLAAESQVSFANNSENLFTSPVKPDAGSVFEVDEYSFGLEQTLNIGSQSSGAGAGKITFNPFSITRSIDKASTTFFKNACAGTAFCWAILLLRKSAGAGGGGLETSGLTFLRFDFKLVAVKSVSWAHDETSPKETIEFEYGALQMQYSQQDASGTMMPAVGAGWNQVTNVSDQSTTLI